MLMDAKILLSQNISNTSHYNTRNASQNLSASEKNVGTRNLLEKVGHKPSFIIIWRAACVLNFCLPQEFSGSCM